MNATIQIDSRKWNAQVASLAFALKADAPIVLRDETRLLLKQCIKFTPPKSSAQGRKAVARDINRAAIPLTEDAFESESLKKLVREGNPQRLRDALSNIQGWQTWTVEEFTPEIHHRARDRRGRVTRGQRVIAHPASEVRAYIKRKHGMVGNQRSGWAVAFSALGGKVSGWWKPKTVRRGFIRDNTVSADGRPSIVFGNSASGISQTETRVRQAIAARTSAMDRRLKLIASGYSREVSQGIRARSRARRSPASFNAN